MVFYVSHQMMHKKSFIQALNHTAPVQDTVNGNLFSALMRSSALVHLSSSIRSLWNDFNPKTKTPEKAPWLHDKGVVSLGFAQHDHGQRAIENAAQDAAYRAYVHGNYAPAEAALKIQQRQAQRISSDAQDMQQRFEQHTRHEQFKPEFEDRNRTIDTAMEQCKTAFQSGPTSSNVAVVYQAALEMFSKESFKNAITPLDLSHLQTLKQNLDVLDHWSITSPEIVSVKNAIGGLLSTESEKLTFDSFNDARQRELPSAEMPIKLQEWQFLQGLCAINAAVNNHANNVVHNPANDAHAERLEGLKEQHAKFASFALLTEIYSPQLWKEVASIVPKIDAAFEQLAAKDSVQYEASSSISGSSN